MDIFVKNCSRGIDFKMENQKKHFHNIFLYYFEKGKKKQLSYPPYSPDTAPADDHLFRSLQNAVHGNTFTFDENSQLFLEQFFCQKR